jgi:hypothetical protein
MRDQIKQSHQLDLNYEPQTHSKNFWLPRKKLSCINPLFPWSKNRCILCSDWMQITGKSAAGQADSWVARRYVLYCTLYIVQSRTARTGIIRKIVNRGDNFSPRMPCQWYVRGGGEGKQRILIGQSVLPTPFELAFGRLKLSPQVSSSCLWCKAWPYILIWKAWKSCSILGSTRRDDERKRGDFSRVFSSWGENRGLAFFSSQISLCTDMSSYFVIN